MAKAMALPLSATSNETAYHDGARLTQPCHLPTLEQFVQITFPCWLRALIRKPRPSKRRTAPNRFRQHFLNRRVANWYALKRTSVTEDYAKDIWRSLIKIFFQASEASSSGNQSSNTD
jgi:hypothetical protein